jgi:formate hydrogenlyase subunit 3/multisubunit Na+/H+ antiporter MnhD subunit
MTGLGTGLLVASLAVPLAFLGACLVQGLRERALTLQWLAPLPGLAAGVLGLSSGPLTGDLPVIGVTLFLDVTGALILSTAALLWVIVSAALCRDGWPDNRFSVSWLLTMCGNIGVFVAGDLVSFYLFYALLSIPAYGLFAFSGGFEPRRAGAVYMAFTIIGEALVLLAFAMLVAAEPHGSTRIEDVMVALPASPWRNLVLGLVVAGFGMKIGTIPFNGWMPLNYRAAPIAAAAVLSGAGVKGGVIGMIRFLPLGFPMEGWGEALVILGFLSAFYGVGLGLTQKDPKVVLAYSSVSQMGVILAALGAALAEGRAELSSGIAFYAANHLLVKAALFLTIGPLVIQRAKSTLVVLATVLALSLAGLPLTGGALAKLALKAPFGNEAEAILTTLSSIATALLMTHLLNCITAQRPGIVWNGPAILVQFWPAIALAAILLPWLLYPAVGEASTSLKPGNILDELWPATVGAGLAMALSRSGLSFPNVPVGDTVVLYERTFRRVLAVGPWLERFDGRLRQWPVAGISLLLIVLFLLTATPAGTPVR